MSIVSVVLEFRSGARENVLADIARIAEISVYGMTETRMITVVEGDDAGSVEEVLKEVRLIKDVIGVYPASFQ